jgi:uncharacterized protein (UPF0548 family)
VAAIEAGTPTDGDAESDGEQQRREAAREEDEDPTTHRVGHAQTLPLAPCRSLWRIRRCGGKSRGVTIRLRRPDASTLADLLERCRSQSVTYSPIGASLDGPTPTGLRRHRWSVPHPDGTFDSAVTAIDTWAVHRGAGLTVTSDGPVALGTNVAMSAPLPVGFVDVTCRVVAVVEEELRHGFAYGTLPAHPETGEEAFLVVRDDRGVRFDVQAVSAPRHPLARLVPALADRLQDAAVRKYLAAIVRLVAS